MRENLMVGTHKYSNPEWDAGFGKVRWDGVCKEKEEEECSCEKKCRERQKK